MPDWIALPLGSVAASVLLHGAAMRMPMQLDSVRRFLAVGVPVGAGVVVFLLAQHGATTRAFAGIAVYAFLCELYLFLFTLVLSSISVATLLRLSRGPVPAADLMRELEPREMVRLRVERLVGAGCLVREGGRLAVARRGRRMLGAFGRLRRLFGHGPYSR